MDGTRLLHAGDPSLEGKSAADATDILGRPYGRLMLDTASGPSGEGWVHYMFPEPGSLFPRWKSSFVKRVVLPTGEPRLIGAGVYDMQLDRDFIVDVVDRAAALVAERGRDAFPTLRDKSGPYRFMDTYVFVDTPEGVELVNPAQPSLEGKNLLELRDVTGKAVTRDSIEAALKRGSAWVDYSWFKPGHNAPAKKQAYVRRVQAGAEVFIVGSGLYVE
jgi:signal transduction histidine kinase